MSLSRKLATERTGVATTTWYYLIGDGGGVQLMTLKIGKPVDLMLAVDLSAHSRLPLWDGHTPMHNCDMLAGDCYYTGSAELAEDLFTRHRESQDPETIWLGLEEYYVVLFS